MQLLSLVLWIWVSCYENICRFACRSMLTYSQSSEKLIGSRGSNRKESEERKLDAGDGTVVLSESGANFLFYSQCINSK